MKELIDKLPIDIVLKIIPYTYKLQNKQLLNDIVSYVETKTLLLDVYYNYWTIEMQEPYPEEYKYWLINDIISYANNYNATMYGYIDKFYNIFMRNNFLHSKKAVRQYLKKFDDKDVTTQINIFLSLLNNEERKELIKIRPNE
uniref:Uncharacterized protein n=1 Tax=viral metagenome TaxID=1070528 RepID=A0A6C0I1W7_9ZZZZ